MHENACMNWSATAARAEPSFTFAKDPRCEGKQSSENLCISNFSCLDVYRYSPVDSEVHLLLYFDLLVHASLYLLFALKLLVLSSR